MNKLAIAAACGALSLICNTASARPTDEQVAQARAECHQKKVETLKLEKTTNESDPVLKQSFRSWESSCTMAQALMDERDGKPVLQAEIPSDDSTKTASQQ